MGPSSLVLKIPSTWLSSSILRSFTKLTSSSSGRSRSRSIPGKFDQLEKKIGALEHRLKGGNSTNASEDIRESVLIYEGGDKDYLRGMLKDLQDEKIELLKQETALITGQAAVESSSRSIPEKFDTLENKIGALEHLLKGGNSTTASEDIRESVLIYEGGDKATLLGILKDLQREKSAIQEEKTALQREKSALQEKETALIISQAAVDSKST